MTLIAMIAKMVKTPGKTDAPAIVHGKLNIPVPRPPQMRLIVASRIVVVVVGDAVANGLSLSG